jgi:hypothetical protein
MKNMRQHVENGYDFLATCEASYGFQRQSFLVLMEASYHPHYIKATHV